MDTGTDAVGPALVKHLRNQGAETVVEVIPGESFAGLGDDRFQIRRGSADDMAMLLAEARINDCRGIIYLWSADAHFNDRIIDPAGLRALEDAVTLVQSFTKDTNLSGIETPPRLYIVTR
jgi:hypothetical protein